MFQFLSNLFGYSSQMRGGSDIKKIFINDSFPNNFNEEEIKEVKRIILHSDGWSKKGYKFDFVNKTEEADIVMNLAHSYYINRKFPYVDLQNLSVCARGVYPIEIYINKDNWDYPPKTYGKNPNVKLYRKYVVNHEVGHALGRDHDPAPLSPNEPCSIMFQQTIRCGEKNNLCKCLPSGSV
jgi:hypothetical protein